MIVTICPVEPFGDYGVMVNWEGRGVVFFDGASAAKDVRGLVQGPDDRLQVRGEASNPVYSAVVNSLLGTKYGKWDGVREGFFGASDFVATTEG